VPASVVLPTPPLPVIAIFIVAPLGRKKTHFLVSQKLRIIELCVKRKRNEQRAEGQKVRRSEGQKIRRLED
jgi:hypothetical protein